MGVTTTPKLDVAVELLCCAIELFVRGDAYFAALHLAGAADELFSVYARQVRLPDGTGLNPAFDDFKVATAETLATSSGVQTQDAEQWAYDRMTMHKNSVKHMRGRNDLSIKFDPEQEAGDVIDRAIMTFQRLRSNALMASPALIDAFIHARTGDA